MEIKNYTPPSEEPKVEEKKVAAIEEIYNKIRERRNKLLSDYKGDKDALVGVRVPVKTANGYLATESGELVLDNHSDKMASKHYEHYSIRKTPQGYQVVSKEVGMEPITSEHRILASAKILNYAAQDAAHKAAIKKEEKKQ